MFKDHKVEIEWGGRPLTLETGKIARQADGAVLATYGETVVLATVVSAKEPKAGFDFFPLTVNYQEKTFAAGKIPGGYFKREGRPSEKETLVSRLIDRPIRPLFVDGYKNDTQVIATVLQHDLENDPDIVAMVAVSAALTLSGVPFMGPIGAARVGYIGGEYILNPHVDEMEETKLDLVVAGTGDAVLMVESEAQQLPEDVMLGAVMFAHDEIKKVVNAIIDLAEKAAKEPWELKQGDEHAEMKDYIRGMIGDDIAKAYKRGKLPDGGEGAVDGGVVGFFSLEMSAEQLAGRILAEASEISSHKIRQGDMNETEFRRFVDAAKELEACPLFIDDTAAIPIAQLAARARRLKRTHGLDLLIVDYLQLVRGTSDNRVRAIAQLAENSTATGTYNELLGEGTLAITIEPSRGKRYQGIVPLEGDCLASCIEAYFRQSEQLDTKVLLFADTEQAAGLMLQALPPQKVTDNDQREANWAHVSTLAASLSRREALALDEETILYRLFHEDKVMLLEPRDVRFECSCSRARVVRALESIGLTEARSILAEQGNIEMNCEFCMASYVFEAPDLDEIFGADPAKPLH